MRGEIPNQALSCHSCSWHRGSALWKPLKLPFLQLWNQELQFGRWRGWTAEFVPALIALSPCSALKSWAGSWKGAEQTTQAIIALAPWLWFAIAAEQEAQFGWPWGAVQLRQGSGEDAPCSALPLGANLHPDNTVWACFLLRNENVRHKNPLVIEKRAVTFKFHPWQCVLKASSKEFVESSLNSWTTAD